MKFFSLVLFSVTISAAHGCKNWCFDEKRCLIPDQSECSKCVQLTCYNDFYYPFANSFGAYCVKHAMSTCCNAVCGYPHNKILRNRFNRCHDCLEPCVDEAKEVLPVCFPPPPPPDAPIEIQYESPLCSECVTENMCLNRTENMNVAHFCRGYIALSCYDLVTNPLDIDAALDSLVKNINPEDFYIQPELLNCIATAWADPCSQCPADIPAERITSCGNCLNNCVPKAECALTCSKDANGPHVYPVKMPCAACMALCTVTPGDVDACKATRCQSCFECDTCYNNCGADPGVIKNTCRCKFDFNTHLSPPDVVG